MSTKNKSKLNCGRKFLQTQMGNDFIKTPANISEGNQMHLETKTHKNSTGDIKKSTCLSWKSSWEVDYAICMKMAKKFDLNHKAFKRKCHLHIFDLTMCAIPRDTTSRRTTEKTTARHTLFAAQTNAL